MISEEMLNRNFALLVDAARQGIRCPQSKPHGPLDTVAAPTLARAGRIRIEIFMHNYRVVTIMQGPHKGKQTKAPPKQGTGKPYKIIYKDHVTMNTRMSRHSAAPVTLAKITFDT